MKRLDFAEPFRRRMRLLVALAVVVMATAPPIVFYAERRHEIVSLAREHAERGSQIVAGTVRDRPALWAFDAPKLQERLLDAGLGSASRIEIQRGDGTVVALRGDTRDDARLLWGAAHGSAGSNTWTVWVGVRRNDLHAATALFAAFSTLLALGLGLSLYLLPVGVVRRSQRHVARLLGELSLTMREDERRRIARDLHDGAGQAITAARLEAMILRRQGNADHERLGRLSDALDAALEEVRRSTTALLPPALAELGLARALEAHCRTFAEAAGIEVRFEAPALPALPAAIETACYRIVQESLTNVARHAEATLAEVRVRCVGDTIELAVTDDGHGAVDASSGYGLQSIAERARLLGGSATISPKAPRGASVQVRLPMKEESP